MIPALEAANELGPSELDGRADADIARALLAQRWDPPIVTDLWTGQPHRGEQHARDGHEPGFTRLVDSRRIPLEWSIGGCAEWLDYWPDGADEDLTPVDRLDGELDLQVEAHKREWNRLRERTARRFVREGSVVKGFIEVPRDDPRPPAEARDAAITGENALFERYIDAVRSAADLHRPDLESRVRGQVSDRRRDLQWDQDLTEGLELRPSPSTLQVVSGPIPMQSSSPPEPLSLPSHQLTDPSLIALLNCIHQWATEIEQYPGTYLKLFEDDVSNLLAVTLALTFGITHREVFCRDGRTDLFVPVAAIRRLQGKEHGPDDEVAFVAEAKKGSGPALADQARDQLEGYIPIRARHAALMFYLEVGDDQGATERILSALRGRPDYEGDDPIAGSPFPLLKFSGGPDGKITSVATVFIKLTSPTS